MVGRRGAESASGSSSGLAWPGSAAQQGARGREKERKRSTLRVIMSLPPAVDALPALPRRLKAHEYCCAVSEWQDMLIDRWRWPCAGGLLLADRAYLRRTSGLARTRDAEGDARL